jgi:hypothetical protein
MARLLDISIAINISGLAVIGALESWRPGFVSGAVNVGLVWIGAVVLLSVTLLVKRRYNNQ